MFAFFDAASFALLLVLTLPILALAGSLKDMCHAFSIAFSRNRQSSALEMKQAVTALKLCRTLLLYSGLFWTLATFIIILMNTTSLTTLGPNLAVAILTPLYACAACILLLPVQAVIEKKLLASEA
ncbi:MAG: hypothetical protein Q4E65_04930 [Clostridia bacterium]|nr:hypothetical protein [Clostridia bacterium]